MTVSNRNPIASSLLLAGEQFSFDLDDGGTTPSSIQVSIEGLETEVAWTLAGGYQAGYSGTASKTGDVYTISIKRDAGWDKSPFTVNVDWTISGTPSTASWSYELATEQLFPNLMQPRNPVSVGDLKVTDNGVAVRTDVGWIDLVGFSVTDMGGGKVKVETGVADHGALTGLADDDHTQYHTDARGDARYPRKLSGAGAPGVSTGNGYALGTVYVDTTGDQSYVLVDATTDANVWSSGITDHGALGGLGDDDHTQYLRADGTRALTGNLTVSGAATIDGRDVSVDGAKLDGIEAGADVTDATNVAAAGAVMATGVTTQQAARFAERADHVNTPAAGEAEIWVKNAATQELVLTDDTGTDRKIPWTTGTFATNNLVLAATAGTDARIKPGTNYLCDANGLLGVAGSNPNIGITERTTGPSSVAGRGALWVKDDTKQGLKFTDDGGVDRHVVTMFTTTGPGNNAILTGYGAEGTVDATTNFTYNDNAGSYQLTLARAGASVKLAEAASPEAVPGAGYGAVWVKNNTPSEPAFTDDAGTDLRLAPLCIDRMFGEFETNATDTWYTWTDAGWAFDTLMADTAGTGTDPSLSTLWQHNGILIPVSGRLESVKLIWSPTAAPATFQTLQWQVVKMAITDGMTTNGTITKVASGSDFSSTSQDKRIVDLTIDSSTLSENDQLFIFQRRIGGDAAANTHVEFAIAWRQLL